MAGAIPIIRPLKESLAGDRIRRVVGILNGTTNYILTRMTEDGPSTATCWPRPRRWATPRPTRPPTSGATTPPPRPRSSPRSRSTRGCTATTSTVRGSSGSRPTDIEVATRLGYVVKLLASPPRRTTTSRSGCTPRSCRATHPLAAVREAFNAIYVEADAAGRADVLRPGRGVVADGLGGRRRRGRRGPQPAADRPRPGRVPAPQKRIRPIAELETQYYVLLDVEDEARACSPTVATRFGRHERLDRPGLAGRAAPTASSWS